MIIPNYLIILPAILAFIVYLWLSYEIDPDNRISDVRMLLSIACFGVIVGQLFTIVQGYDRRVSSVVFCAAAVGLLILAIRMRLKQPLGMARMRGRQ